MDRIYREAPEHWPYGLSIGHLDGGTFLIREASTKKPIGFTGWQKRAQDGKITAYYAIGILPEYREKGFGKEAVSKLIKQIEPEVDEIRGFIVKGNNPSVALAESLNIPYQHKSAHVKESIPRLDKILPTLGALGGAGYGATTYGGDIFEDPGRAGAGIAGNTILGALFGALPRKTNVLPHLATIGAAITGNAALNADRIYKQMKPTLESLEGTSEAYQSLLNTTKDINKDERVQQMHGDIAKALPWAIPTLLAAGLSIPTIMAYNSRQRAKKLQRLAGSSLKLPEEQAVDKAREVAGTITQLGDEVESEEKEFELAKEAGAKKVLGSTLGALLGGGIGYAAHGAPAEDADKWDITSRGFSTVGGAIAGGLGGKLPFLSREARKKGLQQLPYPMLAAALGNVGVAGRKLVGDVSSGLTEQLPAVAEATRNMQAPWKFLQVYNDMFEKHPWMKYMMYAGVPLGGAALAANVYHNKVQEDTLDKVTEQLIDLERNKAQGTGEREREIMNQQEQEEQAMEKQAGWLDNLLLNLAKHRGKTSLGTGLGNAAFWDQYIYGDRDLTDWDAGRAIGAGLGLASGGLVGMKGVGKFNPKTGKLVARSQNLPMAGGSALAMPFERLAMTGAAANEAKRKLDIEQLKDLKAPPKAGVPTPQAAPGPFANMSTKDKLMFGGGLAGLLGVGGYLGHRAVKAMEKPQESTITIEQKPEPARVTMTLPTREPGDAETTVDLPLPEHEEIRLSKSLFDSLGRDVRRRLRAGAKERTRRRVPKVIDVQDITNNLDLLSA